MQIEYLSHENKKLHHRRRKIEGTMPTGEHKSRQDIAVGSVTQPGPNTKALGREV